MTRDLKGAVEALLSAFSKSFINDSNEFIAHRKTNQYFSLSDCVTSEDVDCKVLEWFSRPAHKSEPYSRKRSNEELHQFMLNGINSYFGTRYTEDEIAIIYVRLGNRVNHNLTVQFINGAMSTEWLKNADRNGNWIATNL